MRSHTKASINAQQGNENPSLSHHFTDTLHDRVNHLLANSVVATGVVVGCILFPGNKLLRMEKVSVCPNPHLIWKIGSLYDQNGYTTLYCSPYTLKNYQLTRPKQIQLFNPHMKSQRGLKCVIYF